MGTQLKHSPEISDAIEALAAEQYLTVRLDLNSMGAADGDVWNLSAKECDGLEAFNITVFATEMLPGILVSGRLRIHPAYRGEGWGKLLGEWRDKVAEANGLRIMAMVRTKNIKQRKRLERQGFSSHAWVGNYETGHRLMLNRRLDDSE